jgi:2-dehydro-3-deoxygluconokinase
MKKGIFMDVITFGESMVLFEPYDNGLIQYTDQFRKRVGGAESNVAIGLSKLGHSVSWIGRLGDDPLGRYVFSFLRGEGVFVDEVKFDPSANTGIYFKQTGGYGQTNVYYYRKNSAASFLNPEDIQEEVIGKARFLHITGITPALSKSCHDTVLYAVELAKKHHVNIIFDPNIRKKLWTPDQYIPILRDLITNCDYFLPGEDEIRLLYPNVNMDEAIKDILSTGVKAVIVKTGSKGAHYYTKNESQHVPGFPNHDLKDSVGAGDGFAAGFLSGLIENLSIPEAVKRANLIGCMVTMVHGDVEGLPTKDDLENFVNNTGDMER